MSRFNATTYLEGHGWRGKGVPLDGEQGRGLKKPLALPQKRNVKGLGKERDRATEWWDSLFEASAKKLQAPAPAPATLAAAATAVPKSQVPSLMALAKREHAKKQLMSGFVRGRPNKDYEEKMQALERVLAEQQSANHSIESTPAASESEAIPFPAREDARLSKEERRAARRERKRRKAETAQANDAEKKGRKKRRREDETMSTAEEAKKRKEGVAEDRSGDAVSNADSDKARRKEEKRRKKAEKATKSGVEAETEPRAVEAKKARMKRKDRAPAAS